LRAASSAVSTLLALCSVILSSWSSTRKTSGRAGSSSTNKTWQAGKVIVHRFKSFHLASYISLESVKLKHIQHQGLAKTNFNFPDRAIAKKKRGSKRRFPGPFVFPFRKLK